MIPSVIGALDTVTRGLLKRQEDLEMRGRLDTIETTTSLIGQNTEKNPGDPRRLVVTQ